MGIRIQVCIENSLSTLSLADMHGVGGVVEIGSRAIKLKPQGRWHHRDVVLSTGAVCVILFGALFIAVIWRLTLMAGKGVELVIVEDVIEKFMIGLVNTAGVKQLSYCLFGEVDLLAAVVVGNGCEADGAGGLAVFVDDSGVDSVGTVHGGLFRYEDWVEAAVVGEDIEAHVNALV